MATGAQRVTRNKISIVFKGKKWGSHSCGLCTKSYVNSRDLRRHIRHKHGTQETQYTLERTIQETLHTAIGGQKETHCEWGKIDLETPTHVVEVKRVAEWKHALGQVLVYARATGKRPWIHTFGGKLEERRMKEIKNILQEHGVKHTHHVD